MPSVHKMIKHALKILEYLLLKFQRVFDHFQDTTQYRVNHKTFLCNFATPTKCGALRELVPCAQFKKREKHPWSSVTFSKVAR